MSNAKITNSPASNDPDARVVRDKNALIRAKKPPDVEALAIDENDDFGGDGPSTGPITIPAIR